MEGIIEEDRRASRRKVMAARPKAPLPAGRMLSGAPKKAWAARTSAAEGGEGNR